MKTAFVVLGMHRSGTSSVAGLLALLGATPPRTLMGAKPENPKGFWESEVLMAFDDEILTRAGSSWDDAEPLDQSVFRGEQGDDLRRRAGEKLHEEFGGADTIVIKDPRICRFYPFWREVLIAAGYEPFVVIPVRDPAEVAASLHARNGMAVEEGLKLWRRHVEDAEAATRGQRRHVLIWRDLLDDWRSAVTALSKDLGRPLHGDESEIIDFLDPSASLHSGQADLNRDTSSSRLYARIKLLAATPDSASTTSRRL